MVACVYVRASARATAAAGGVLGARADRGGRPLVLVIVSEAATKSTRLPTSSVRAVEAVLAVAMAKCWRGLH
jgi:hypothetical protein